MTHVLRHDEARGARPLHRRLMSVMVRVGGTQLVIQPGLHAVQASALFVPLPERFTVVAPDGTVCHATGRFMISTETIDPIHFVVDEPMQEKP